MNFPDGWEARTLRTADAILRDGERHPKFHKIVANAAQNVVRLRDECQAEEAALLKLLEAEGIDAYTVIESTDPNGHVRVSDQTIGGVKTRYYLDSDSEVRKLCQLRLEQTSEMRHLQELLRPRLPSGWQGEDWERDVRNLSELCAYVRHLVELASHEVFPGSAIRYATEAALNVDAALIEWDAPRRPPIDAAPTTTDEAQRQLRQLFQWVDEYRVATRVPCSAHAPTIVPAAKRFLAAVESLPIENDPKNAAKQHPDYPRGRCYRDMYDAAGSLAEVLRPAVYVVESGCYGDNVWYRTLEGAVRSLLYKTYGLRFFYWYDPNDESKRTILWQFGDPGLHKCRMVGGIHGNIPETMRPLPEFKRQDVELLREAIERIESADLKAATSIKDESLHKVDAAAIAKNAQGLPIALRSLDPDAASDDLRFAWESVRRTMRLLIEQVGSAAVENTVAETLDDSTTAFLQSLIVYLREVWESKPGLRSAEPQPFDRQELRNLADAIERSAKDVLGEKTLEMQAATPLAKPPAALSTADEIEPNCYLFGWPEIIGALKLRDDDELRSRIRRLSNSNKHPGPIMVAGQGGQPRVEKRRLIAWWNSLGDRFDEIADRERDTAASVEDQYKHGRDAEVVPNINGAVKRRRRSKQ